MNWRNFKDEELSRAYQDTYRKAAFANTPRWKKVCLWVICLFFPLLGLTAIFQMLERAPMAFSVMVGLGAIGGIVLAFVLKAEQEFRRDQLGIVAELDRRGLYDNGGVRFVAPWEDPTRP